MTSLRSTPSSPKTPNQINDTFVYLIHHGPPDRLNRSTQCDLSNRVKSRHNLRNIRKHQMDGRVVVTYRGSGVADEVEGVVDLSNGRPSIIDFPSDHTVTRACRIVIHGLTGGYSTIY